MISISCSNLEQVRKNHIPFSDMISMGERPQRGGTHGMFAYWQDIAKLFHIEELDINESIKELQNKFLHFENTKRNKDKQTMLLHQFVIYAKKHKSEKLHLLEGRKRIAWHIIPDIRLTGLTPWIFKKGSQYHAYFCIEKMVNWKLELKYPLLQKYIIENILKCDLDDLYIGFYCLEKSDFEFKNYSAFEVKKALTETQKIFESVNSYCKKKIELMGK